ncbi:T9SS type B sorting domain-containing protein [Flavobacterium zepuense]|uniref:T9SS type B sorting domain-containing protein n=1 Tax=Flavobacterium zepuense TaxID=2593302 RepID=A0A552V1E7_9FLAO|nr:gliding motility-associated C-terminal domain-containing protein [Flavobacterium zepuense]TRW24284.1 T9SS type B sorting domain-containing protein [Flavobacterium zepuense]
MERKITTKKITALLFVLLINCLSYAQPCATTGIATFAPASGPASTVVTISGIGFQNGSGVSAILFNGITSSGFTVISDTQIKAVVPQDATSGIISVVMSNCTATTLTPFTVFESACPTLPGSSFSAQPLSQAICEGADAQYTATINGGTGFTYQWKMLTALGTWVSISDDAIFSGTNTTTLTLTDTPAAYNGAQFYCQATSGTCLLISNATQLTVSSLPVVVMLPTQPTCLTPTGSLIIMPLVGDNLTYSINGTDFQSLALFSNLTPGSYLLTVKTSAGCTTAMPFTINAVPPLPAVANITVNQPDCNGVTTGSIIINSPINLGLTYSIDGVNFQSSTTFSNLAPGTYTVTVSTALGCLSVSATVTINEVPTPPAAATTMVTQPDCDTPTGTITVNAPTGTGLTYSIDGTNFQNGTTFANLAPGQYTVTVQGTGGCTSQTLPVTINAAPVQPVIATTTVTQPDCDTPTGSIIITAPIGTGLTYSIDGTTFQSGTTFANLSQGNYTVIIQGVAGCTSQSLPVTINAAPLAPAVAVTTVTQPTCTVTSGTINVSSPTGTGITYSINGTDFQTETTFANLAAGQYTLTVQNAGGCTSQSAPVTINAIPVAPAIASIDVTQPTCTSSIAKIVVTSPIGNGFTYSIDGTTFQANPTFTNLSEGNYTVTVQNIAGCFSETLPVTINAIPVAPAVPAYTVAHPTCVAKGSITLTATPEVGLTYSIDGTTFQAGLLFANLDPGTYTIIVMNADGCTAQTGIITLNPIPDAPAVAIANATQPVCNGIVTGSIIIASPTGTGLTYSIDGGTTYQSGTIFNNVAVGSYTVTVLSTEGCTSESAPIVIAAPVTPAVATFNFTQPDCTTGGSIVVTAPLGAEYTYSIDGINYQAGTTFTNLAGGTYQVTVMGQGGCTSVTAPITISNSPVPAVAATVVAQPNCFNNFGTIEITAPLGSSYSYSIDGGLTYQTSPVFTSLTPNSYTVTVSSNGCTSVTPSIVLVPAPGIPAAPVVSTIQPTCTMAGGTIVVGGSAGNTGYSFSIDGINYQTANSFSGLQPGTYNVIVRNEGGCTSTPVMATIIQATGEVLLTSTEGCKSMVGDSGYMLEVMLANNDFDIEDVTINWTDANGNEVGDDRTFNVSQYVADNNIDREDYPLQFTATVTTPGGCDGTIAFTVENAFCDIPKGISPNSDGMNDNFDISGLNASKLSIFNRHGKEVYSRNAYKNEWYGQTDNDEELPTGTYYYVIDTNGGSKTGWVYINRQD